MRHSPPFPIRLQTADRSRMFQTFLLLPEDCRVLPASSVPTVLLYMGLHHRFTPVPLWYALAICANL